MTKRAYKRTLLLIEDGVSPERGIEIIIHLSKNPQEAAEKIMQLLEDLVDKQISIFTGKQMEALNGTTPRN